MILSALSMKITSLVKNNTFVGCTTKRAQHGGSCHERHGAGLHMAVDSDAASRTRSDYISCCEASYGKL